VNPAAALAGGIVLLASVAAVAAAWRPRARGLPGGRLAASAALLGAWGALGVGGAAGGFALALPEPFGTLVFGLHGLAGGCALLAGVLFGATGIARAGGYRPGGSGTVLLEHALLVAVAWLLASRTPLGLLAGWEAMSLISYLLVVRDRPRTRRAAWALLALSELGSALLLFAMAVWQGAATLGDGWRLAVALIALFAFGAKAGLFPLLIWIPFAEPEADGDVAGLLSGLLTSVAVVGFLRVARWTGAAGLPLGVVTGALGLLGAVGAALMGVVERDAKRVLAYGTLEALGLTFVGLGLAWTLQAAAAGGPAVMAAAGALVLLLAHAGGKYALFLLAGHVEQAGGLRLLDRMGGMLARARRGGAVAVLAVLSLAGLPPFGGFLGEWLLIEACLVPTPAQPALHVALALLAAVLALIAALGLTVYLRWFAAWLGPARTPRAATLADVPAATALAGWLGAAVAATAGIGAGWVLPWLGGQIAWLASGPALVAPTYLRPQAYAAIVALGAALFRGVAGSTGNVLFPAGGFSVGSPWDLAACVLVGGLVVAGWRARVARMGVRRVRTWVGGEPEAHPNLAFTAEGLSHPLRLTFAGFYGLERSRRPLAAADETVVADLAPPRLRYRARVLLRLEHHLYRPLLRWAAMASAAVRRTQSGRVSHYVGYLLAAALLGLVVLAR
jgi:hydrogenase-4 component B